MYIHMLSLPAYHSKSKERERRKGIKKRSYQSLRKCLLKIPSLRLKQGS
uniref:Uncharacterized protein n=1 Tax=Rhizophora mucronata TaxID=61149 RepID=A0A2P2PHC4_RHIMU